MGESRWIVLIDKTPRGPLTESEVRTLIEQHVIRLNDLAAKLSNESGTKKSEWKFLWQFAEFDRRRDEEGKTDPIPQERREGVNETQANAQKKQLLPDELENIHPEDLAYHLTSMPGIHEKHSFESTVFENLSPPTLSHLKAFNWKAFAAIPVMLVAGLLAFKLTQQPPSAISISPVSPQKPEPVPSEQEVSHSSPLSKVRPNFEKKETRNELPPAEEPIVRKPSNQEKDSGDISYDEYRRRQEEQLEREKQEEEARYKAEEAEGEEDPPKKKKKSSQKRKAASEEDEDVQDPLEETQDEEAPED